MLPLGSNQFTTRARKRVMTVIQRLVEEGQLTDGACLPAERQLAQLAEVSRQTLRAALTQLENDGYISGGGRRHLCCADDWLSSIMSRTVILVSNFQINFDVTKFGHTGFNKFIGAGVLSELQKTGFSSMTVHPSQLTESRLQALCGQRPAGALCLQEEQDPAVHWVKDLFTSHNLPFVAYGTGELFADIDTVYADHYLGGFELTMKLVSAGRRRIQRLWRMDNHPGPRPWLAERDRGYEQACAQAGVPGLPALRCECLPVEPCNEQNFQNSVRHLAGLLIEMMNQSPRIDAIMVNSDRVVPLIHAALRIFGCVPNQDILVVGYDHFWIDMPTRIFENAPPWATAEKQHLEIGRRMVQLLDRRFRRELPDEPQHELVPPRIVGHDELQNFAERFPPSPPGYLHVSGG